jgi:general L-amino acid transport system substrate-binding protein
MRRLLHLWPASAALLAVLLVGWLIVNAGAEDAASSMLHVGWGKAQILPYAVEQNGFEALQKGAAQIVVGVTPSAANLAFYGVTSGPPIFYDGQGFMVHRASGIHSLADLAGRKVCFIDGTETGPIPFAAMKARGIRFIPFPFQEEGEMNAGLVVGHCEAVTADASKLAECARSFTAWSMISRSCPKR